MRVTVRCIGAGCPHAITVASERRLADLTAVGWLASASTSVARCPRCRHLRSAKRAGRHLTKETT